MKRILSFAIMLIIIVSIASCGVDNEIPEMTVDNVIERKVIIAGLYEGIEPFSYKNETGSYAGFDLKVCKEIAKRLGVTLNLRTISAEEAASSLASGKVDFLGNNLLLSEKELDQFEEADEIFENRQVFVVTDTSEFKKQSLLRDKKIGILAGDSRNAFREEGVLKKAEPVEFASREDALVSLNAGNVDALIIDEAWVYAKKAEGEQLTIVGEELEDRDYAMVFRKNDDELRKRVEKIIDEMRRDGTLSSIAQEVFGAEYLIFD